MSTEPKPVERDSRGILDPWLLRQRVRLTRYPAGAALEGLVDRFWVVRWELPPGLPHRQQVLTHPGANLSVGHPGTEAGAAGRIEARLHGVAPAVTTRVLVGQGWTVAAMTRPGGLGAFITGSASELTDRSVALGEAIGTDEAMLLRLVDDATDEASRVAVLSHALQQAVDPSRVTPARQVAEVAGLAETDRSVRRLKDLSARAGVGERTLQRLFQRYAGVSPTWVLRRYRLLDAAEAVRGGESVSWVAVAADLGYADQAHLIRDFRAAVGKTPGAYAASQPPAGQVQRFSRGTKSSWRSPV